MLAGSVILFFMPSYVGYIESLTHASPSQLGLIAGCETWAIAMASLLSPVWSQYLSIRLGALIGALVCLLGNLSALMVTDITLLLAIRIPTGFFEGVLYALSFKVLGRTDNPVRAMGVASTALVIVGTSGLWLAPRIGIALNVNGSIAILALLCVTLLPLVWTAQSHEDATFTAPTDRDSARPWVGLVGQTLWFGGPGAVWAFATPIATQQGLSPATIADALALGAACGVVGPLFCGWFGDRAGKVPLILISTVGMLGATIFFVNPRLPFSIGTDLVALNIFWNVGSVYMFALICVGDTSGRASLLVPASHALGFAVGPMAAGFLADRYGYGVMPSFLAGISLIAFVVLVPLWISSRTTALRAAPATEHIG
ncbi:MAG: hypothetical protein DI547_17030 [Sphingobium sp.]|nr:MAG: hypothetical protein DI547_17030 [Sphingobium sp.]